MSFHKKNTYISVTAALLFLIIISAPANAENPSVISGKIGQGTIWETTYYIVDSGNPGPVVLITAGVHGNEHAGIRAANQIKNWDILRGKLVIIPRVNEPGIQSNRRLMPVETDEDLNRNFPRSPVMNPKGELASYLWRFVSELNPDWHIDLHESRDFRKVDPSRFGNSIIYYPDPETTDMGLRMLTTVNSSITD